MDANLSNGSLFVQGVDACKPAGLVYSSVLADLFLELPLMKEFKRRPLQAFETGRRENAVARHSIGLPPVRRQE